MIRSIPFGLASLVLITIMAVQGSSAATLAQDNAPTKPKTGTAATTAAVPSKTTAPKATPAKTAAKPDLKKPTTEKDTAAAGKPLLVATYGDWGAYAAKAGPSKTCYALAQPKDRQPPNLKRDPAYIFIADRPAENVHNEISIIMGFDVKSSGPVTAAAGNAASAVPDASVEVGPAKFALIAKGSNLWLENLAKEPEMIAAMRKSSKLTVRAASLKGNVTTDNYSLLGLAQALDRAQKECQ